MTPHSTRVVMLVVLAVLYGAVGDAREKQGLLYFCFLGYLPQLSACFGLGRVKLCCALVFWWFELV